MRSWVKRLLWAGFVIIAVWLLVILYWRASTHIPSISDVLMYLILIPVILLLSVFMVWKMLPNLAMIGDTGNPDRTGAGAHLVANQDQESIPSERKWALSIVSDSAITRFGKTTDDLAAALIARETGFALDPELNDAHGYPILSGRIADLDANELFSRFEQWAADHDLSADKWEAEDQRAVALGHDVFMELVQTLLSHLQLSGLMSGTDANAQERDWPIIYLIGVLPERWLEHQKSTLVHWFADLVVQQGWPAEKFVIPPLGVQNVIDPLILLDRLNVQVHQQNMSGFFIFMASQSFLGEKTLAAWQAERRPDKSRNKTGKMPGEAAAGLLMADSAWAPRLSSQFPVRIHRTAQRRRDKSADEAGKIKPDVLINTIKDALAVAGINAEQIASVSADTDARASRVGELFEALNETVPEMELTASCFRLEADCGAMGAVAGLAALALARQQVMGSEQAVLCVCNNDSLACSAVVLDPEPVKQAPADPATA